MENEKKYLVQLNDESGNKFEYFSALYEAMKYAETLSWEHADLSVDIFNRGKDTVGGLIWEFTAIDGNIYTREEILRGKHDN